MINIFQKQQRQFIRIFTQSLLNCSQQSSNNSYRFLKRELSENPEFDKAFPQLSQYKKGSKLIEKSEEVDFIDSLTDEHRVLEREKEEEIDMGRHRRYVDGYRSPTGPLKYMKQQDIDKINLLANKRLQELEDLHCSKEQILHGIDKSGLKLIDDPFFQYIKNNAEARKTVIKGGEEYSVKRIVEIALRQDVGLDKSQTNEKYLQMVGKEEHESHFQTGLRDHQMFVKQIEGNRYYGADQKIDVDQFRMLYDQNRKYHLRQIKRSEHRRLTKQHLNSYDINWRNTELLTKFLQHSGQIKNRYQTRLSQTQQRMISKQVKTARQMLLLPYIGNIRANNRKSLKTLQEDVEDYTRQIINVDSGSLYMKAQSNPEREQNEMDAFKSEEEREQDYAQRVQAMRETTDLELNYMPPMPNEQQLGLLSAQVYAKKMKELQLVNQGEDIQKIKEQMKQPVDYDNPLFQELEEMDVKVEIDNQVLKDSYEKVTDKYNKSHVNSSLASLFLNEKALNVNQIDQQSNVNEETSEKSLEQLLSDLSALKEKLKI